MGTVRLVLNKEDGEREREIGAEGGTAEKTLSSQNLSNAVVRSNFEKIPAEVVAPWV